MGGHRVVNYYELTKHEIDRIGERRAEGARSYAIAAFAFGLAVDTIKDFAFSPPQSAFQQGVWATLLIVSLIVTAYFALDGHSKNGAAKSSLESIQNEHDFN